MEEYLILGVFAYVILLPIALTIIEGPLKRFLLGKEEENGNRVSEEDI